MALGFVVLLGPGTAGAQEGPSAIVLELTGVVDPFAASYIEGAVEDAQGTFDVVVLTIDTPGGLDSSMRSIVQAIANSQAPVVCYVSPEGARAASAGTFILIACPVAAMAPSTNVGAAHPVGVSGAIELEKAENDAAAYIRSLAERRGRNADWAERAVRDSVSASAQEALELDVIDFVSPSLPALLARLDGRTVEVADGRRVTLSTTGMTVERRNMGAGLSLLHILLSPNLAFIFFYLGVALVVAEFFVPGGILGVIGAISLVLAIMAFGMLPVQLIGVSLLIASVAFFLLELKLPGHAIGTGLGLASLVLGGLFLFDPSVPGAGVSPWVIAPVALFAGVFFLFVIRAAIAMWRRKPASGVTPLLGAEGTARTAVDPTGTVHVRAEEWTAVTDAGPIPAGTRVRVLAVEGLRLKVEPIAEPIRPETPAGSSASGG
jgi:membrane-bound serine protease (ClpP class)